MARALLVLVALLVAVALADECDKHLSDCGACLSSAGCGWCSVGGFRFCVDKSTGFCRPDEWADTCEATHKVEARQSIDPPACAAVLAVEPCVELSLFDCINRVSTDCVVCVLEATDATCNSVQSTVVGTTPPPGLYPNMRDQGFRWARSALGSYSPYSSPYSSYGPYTTAPATTPPATTPPATAPPATTPPATTPPATAPPATTPAATTPAPPATTTPAAPATTTPAATTPAPTLPLVTTAPATTPPLTACSVSFVGAQASSFIEALLNSLVTITITLNGIQSNPTTAVQCRSDLQALLNNEFNLWITHHLNGGSQTADYHDTVVLNYNVLTLQFDVVGNKRQSVNDLASSFSIANVTDATAREFAALFANNGAGLLGPLQGHVTSVSVSAPAEQGGTVVSHDLTGGELAAIVAVVAVFVCMICVATGYFLFRRSQLGKTPFAAAQASGPQS